jgi:hypothetical protein
MSPQTGPPSGELLVIHALSLKQVATVVELAAMTALRAETVEQQLATLDQAGEATLRARQQLWQLTPQGTARHTAWLADEAVDGPGVEQVRRAYDDFLPLNVAFKEQCGEWQLRNGQLNDHEDRAYDAAVVEGLREIDARAAGVLATMSTALPRLSTYRPRLAEALARLQQGDPGAFTGVLQGSYHDIWMELHQDLIVTLGIDRRAEGSA